jgi:hypothetical protein
MVDHLVPAQIQILHYRSLLADNSISAAPLAQADAVCPTSWAADERPAAPLRCYIEA